MVPPHPTTTVFARFHLSQFGSEDKFPARALAFESENGPNKGEVSTHLWIAELARWMSPIS